MPESEYIDTQGMTGGRITGEVPKEPIKHPPMPVREMKIFTDQERKELKEIINEVLDDRVYKHEDDSWLYRGTY